MTDWLWANAPRPGRLLAEETRPGMIHFTDTVADERIRVEINGHPLDTLMLVRTGMPARPSTVAIDRQQAKAIWVGSGIAERQVWHFVRSDHAAVLRAGLTIHQGAFSSTPHTFELNPEPGFEEVFYFIISGGGKALIEGDGLWPNGERVNAAWPVTDGQLVQVPMGSHRVVALPDVDGNVPQVAYVWCYLALYERWEKR